MGQQAVIWLLLACADKAPVETAEPVDLLTRLAEPGAHAVGFSIEDLSYNDAITAAERTLRLCLWYPSPDTSGQDADYLVPQDDPGAWQDAAPAAGPFPLVVFSHGHQGFAENSSFLMEHLASHGFVVVAPDHTGNTTFDGSDRQTEIYAQRPGDLSAVLDHLLALPADHALAGAVADGPVLAIGHSFGGYTVFAIGGAEYDVEAIAASCADGTGGDVCDGWDDESEPRFSAGFADDRVGAVLAMAPGDDDLFGAGVASLDVPALLMTGTLDGSTATSGASYAAQIPDGAWANLEGAGHQTFTDFWFLETDPNILDHEEAWRIIDVYALAFALELQGEAEVAGVLDGSETVSEVVSLETMP